MARIEKYSTGIVGVIKHNIREFKNGICPTNMEVDFNKTAENYSIIRRGETAKDIEKYRKKIEGECFHYNRKNIVRCNEVVCTLPADCPLEQERAFFEESYKYICSTLPMREKCVFLAEVHCDEGRVLKDGITVVQGQKHLHVMYVPAVPDLKHEGYNFKLCSDELTRRAILKQWHPNYQKWLDDAGIHATVASGVTSGKGISVKSLKEISKETGLNLDQIKSLKKENQKLYSKLMEKEQELTVTHQTITKRNSIISELREYAVDRDSKIDVLQEKVKSTESALLKEKVQEQSSIREKADLQKQLQEYQKENQLLKAAAQKIISDKDLQLKAAHEKLVALDQELGKARARIQDLESKQKNVEISYPEQNHTWGDNSWGSNRDWGNPDLGKQKTYEEEKIL